MAKETRVPETREAKPNREQRRHPEQVGRADVGAGGVSRDAGESGLHGVQDVADVRAKNSGHGKKTADKWNQ
jgi:hypothetical protein